MDALIGKEVIGIILALLGIVGFIIKIDASYRQKIGRIYERFDEYKKFVNEQFVQRDMCKIIHDNGAANFIRLEARVEAGFKNLDEKITELLKK